MTISPSPARRPTRVRGGRTRLLPGYPRSFSDSNGDGVGDLGGVVDRLGYLELLGIDAIWLSPVMRSHMADHGYDVSDRGTSTAVRRLATMDTLIAEAHARGIRVTMDLVPNHTSDQHRGSVRPSPRDPAASPGSATFRDGRGPGGREPPNNWPSVFGGPAWTRITESDGSPGQWYLHIFAAEQPDLNWDHPEVFDDLEKTLRFWLHRASTAFGSMARTACQARGSARPRLGRQRAAPQRGRRSPVRQSGGARDPRGIRAVMNEYPHAMAVGEIWVRDNERLRVHPPDELHLGFNFRLARRRSTPTRCARDRELARRGRPGRRHGHVDVVEPRRRTRGHPVRQRVSRDDPCPRDGAGRTRAAGGG
ncbi:hypothetical protein GS571_20060, partial [Rhodococcus hoagii]|nr:hypothetical protein [Prescottella equi]